MMRVVAGLLMALVAAAAIAQTNVRVRGTITAVSGDTLSVKTREGRSIQLHLTPDAQVVTAKKTTLQEMGPNAYVGVTSVKDSQGRLVAKEVHSLGPQLPQMHGPWDSTPNSFMTNANIAANAQSSGGNELTLKYKDGEQKITVPNGTPIVGFDSGDRSALKKGETIWTNARVEGDGKLVTNRVQVSKGGVKPEH